MTPEEVIAAIKTIRKDHPQNLMARYFDENFFRGLDDLSKQRLTRIIKTGIENADSQMGAYAMHPDDYDLFPSLLDPMIREYHGIASEVKISQQHNWDSKGTVCDLGAIDERLEDVSMRVRVARNLSTLPLPGAMNKTQRLTLEDLAVKAFDSLRENPDFGGRYLSITPGSANEIDGAEYTRRVQAHQMFKDMSGDRYLKSAGISADWPYGRGMYISGEEDFLVWVGEEDHLRVMAMQHGGNLNLLFERLYSGLRLLQNLLPPFATSPRYGNVTSCPTNLGAGMRASLHLKLPSLTSDGKDLSRLKDEAKELGLAVRGAGGEHSDAGEGGLVDISPTARLGVTEMEVMRRLYDGTRALWTMETAAASNG